MRLRLFVILAASTLGCGSADSSAISAVDAAVSDSAPSADGGAAIDAAIDASSDASRDASSPSDASSSDGGDASTLPGWKLVWSDEFNGPNGSGPDPANWVYDVGWGEGGWGNNELEYYTSSRDNSFMQDGSLVIEARTDDLQPSMICGTSPCKYTSARINTLGKFAHQYGRFEARIEIPTGSGMWPAFWTMGSDYPSVGWPACGEIDVMENWGADGRVIAGTTHDPGSNPENGISGQYTFSSIATVANDYHLYVIEWDANAVRFYVDTTEYHCVRKPGAPASVCGSIAGVTANAPHTWPFDKPFFILLNLAIDSSTGNQPNASTHFPAQMLVDYVRVYDKAP
jgi:beta-glucanase (GH16 family)